MCACVGECDSVCVHGYNYRTFMSFQGGRDRMCFVGFGQKRSKHLKTEKLVVMERVLQSSPLLSCHRDVY